MGEGGMASIEFEILGKAYRVLAEFPLCDNCLGRLFAGYGRGLSNRDRGRAIKTLLLMKIHGEVSRGGLSEDRKGEVIRVLNNMGKVSETVLKEVFGVEPEFKSCYICGGDLEVFLDSLARKVVDYLKERDLRIRSFVVGCRVARDIIEREENLCFVHGIEGSESIRSEIKRELGKRVMKLTGLRVDFDRPDVVVLVSVPGAEVMVNIMPLLILGRYWKLGRRISQALWISRSGVRKYPFSIEEALEPLIEVFDASDLILHAAGREDVDVRMLGGGRHFVVELKEARNRLVNLNAAALKVNEPQSVVKVVLEREVSRRDVRLIKVDVARKPKVYKCLVLSNEELKPEDLKLIEEYFNGIRIKQRTPKRVLHRRPDILRIKKVYCVRTRWINSHVFEALVKCEGGLYVKELVSGDEGRTTPSFSEVTGKELKCIELDVVFAHE